MLMIFLLLMDVCIFAQNGPWIYLRKMVHIVPIAHPLVCRNVLNIKLFKVSMRAKKVVVTFTAIVFFLKFSWDIFTAFIPLEFGMLV